MVQIPQYKTGYPESDEERKWRRVLNFMTQKVFLNRTPIIQAKTVINKWDLIKLNSFCKAKDTIILAKQQFTEWENIFTNYIYDRGLLSKI